MLFTQVARSEINTISSSCVLVPVGEILTQHTQNLTTQLRYEVDDSFNSEYAAARKTKVSGVLPMGMQIVFLATMSREVLEPRGYLEFRLCG